MRNLQIGFHVIRHNKIAIHMHLGHECLDGLRQRTTTIGWRNDDIIMCDFVSHQERLRVLMHTT